MEEATRTDCFSFFMDRPKRMSAAQALELLQNIGLDESRDEDTNFSSDESDDSFHDVESSDNEHNENTSEEDSEADDRPTDVAPTVSNAPVAHDRNVPVAPTANAPVTPAGTPLLIGQSITRGRGPGVARGRRGGENVPAIPNAPRVAETALDGTVWQPIDTDRIQKTEEQEGGSTSTDSRHRPCGRILVSRGNVRE